MDIKTVSINHIEHGRERYVVTFECKHGSESCTCRATAYADDLDNAADGDEVVAEALSKVIDKMEQFCYECDNPEDPDVVKRKEARVKTIKGGRDVGKSAVGKKPKARSMDAARAKREKRAAEAEEEAAGGPGGPGGPE